MLCLRLTVQAKGQKLNKPVIKVPGNQLSWGDPEGAKQQIVEALVKACEEAGVDPRA